MNDRENGEEIRYVTSLEGVAPEALVGFFEGWPNPPSPETHLAVLRGSHAVVLSMVGNRVVGFVNAISDGRLFAFIPMLEVLPEYRGRGVGAELMRRVADELGDLYALDLVCDHDLIPYYRRLGWCETSSMSLRRYDRQSGAMSRAEETQSDSAGNRTAPEKSMG